MEIKVLHIVGGDLNSGAGRGAYWLHQGLVEQGVLSKILTNSAVKSSDENVWSIAQSTSGKVKNILRRRLDKLPQKLFYDKEQKYTFSPSLFGYDISNHPLFDWADIIHLHWINGGFIDISDLKQVIKPIVWTLRDMWPFTGGCHYSMECTNYESGCGRCYQLNSHRKFDLSRYVYRRKMRHYPKTLNIVGISEWLTSCARRSLVFKDLNVITIYNNVNTNDFFPVNKKVARVTLGLKTNKRVLLVGAQSINAYYKGFAKFLQSLDYLNPDDYFLVFFGNIDQKLIESLRFEYKQFGFLNDAISMRLIYSAADLFVAPSMMEAFGKTIVEALACGTPVVCFDSGGPSEIVLHKTNGYKAKSFSASDLSVGIEWVSKRSFFSQELFSYVKRKFGHFEIAKSYLELYKGLSFL